MNTNQVAFLKWLAAQDAAVSVAEASVLLNMTYDATRKRFVRADQYLGKEERRVPVKRGYKPTTETYYHVLEFAKSKLDKYPYVPALEPRKTKIINSVFALGSL